MYCFTKVYSFDAMNEKKGKSELDLMEHKSANNSISSTKHDLIFD